MKLSFKTALLLISMQILIISGRLWAYDGQSEFALADVAPDRFVLNFKQGTTKTEIEKLSLWVAAQQASLLRKFPDKKEPLKAGNEGETPLADLSRVYEVRLNTPLDLRPLIRIISHLPTVEWVEPYYKHQLCYQPNDPLALPAANAQYNALNLIKAYDAWNVTKGDTSVTIGIIDAGLDVFHEDLRNKIQFNLADPINGIDDDNNGYLDDYYGWNFYDNNNNMAIATGSNGHGQIVASIAAAEGDNNRGITGIAFKSRFVPIVGFGPNNASASDLYAPIVYAADRGCKVINLSWGRNRNNPSQYEKLIIRYAAINKGATIVAAAGNTSAELDFLPASYQYVTSVGYNDPNDQLDQTATYSTFMDLTAPGTNIWSVSATGAYTNAASGSSFAAPMVAGGAALVKSVYPWYNGLQVAELLRVNTDNNRFTGTNRNKFDRVGSGRLNLVNAVTAQKQISLRAEDLVLKGKKSGSSLASSDTLLLSFRLVNYLNGILGGTVTASLSLTGVTAVRSGWTFGALPTLGSLSNTANPFVFVLPGQIPTGSRVTITFRFTANNYQDEQVVKVNLNNDFITLGTERFTGSYGSNARIGLVDVAGTLGLNLQLDQQLLLAAGGLVIGVSEQKVPNNIVDTASKDNHFGNLARIQENSRFQNGQQAINVFNDSLYGLNRPGLRIRQTVTALNQTPANRTHLLEYEVTNTSATIMDSVSVAVFTDWDLNNYNANRADWDTANSIGYTYTMPEPTGTLFGQPLYAGIQVIGGGEPQYFASDLDGTVQGTNLNFNGGFSLANKFRCISRGLLRTRAGYTKPKGGDVASLTGIKIRRLLPGQRSKVAFAIGAGYSLPELRSTLNSAKLIYGQGKTGPVPVVNNQVVCAGSDVYIIPSNGSRFRFYDRPGLSAPLAEGRFLRLENIKQQTQIYITNADSVFESQAATATINVTGPVANFQMTPNLLDLRFGNTVNFTNTSQSATSYTWDFGNGTSTLTSPVWQFTQPGTYPVRLVVRQSGSPCSDTITQQLPVFIGPLSVPEPVFGGWIPAPNPVLDKVELPAVAYWTLQNAIGQMLYEGQSAQVDMAPLPTGVYYLKIRQQVWRLVK